MSRAFPHLRLFVNMIFMAALIFFPYTITELSYAPAASLDIFLAYNALMNFLISIIRY